MCNRWTQWRIDCGVTSKGSSYDYDLDYSFDTYCDITVTVTKSRSTGRVSVRKQHDLSCLGG